MKLCANCQRTKPVSEFYVRNKNTGNTFAWCKQCLNDYSSEKHAELKARAIEYKGGKCMICGYCKYSGALVFHHIDPSQKDFGIAQNRSRRWERVVIELDKCVLLCGNCHQEVHAGLAQLP